ncbi:hypothetical protein [Dysosmobacter sp.]|uniref:hypothetical protein n=1 Tax=Dysosmobacter sp. TaxID=2591382 RepID=UPI002A903E6B|nr:hypothetical protein [Dysosmobacter sp.]MDY3282461.1 hypothetical protein [Dysosmobacter sp.]
MKRSALAAILTLAVLAAMVLRLYGSAYPIAPDGSNLESYAADYLARGASDPGPLKLYESIDLGDRRWTLMEWGEDLGALRLEKGLNGRFRLTGASYGSANFQEWVVEAGGGKYFLLGGRNACFNIGQVTVTLSGREYHMDIPEGDRFFTAVEVDSRTEENRAGPESLRFYDRAGNELTEQIRWN